MLPSVVSKDVYVSKTKSHMRSRLMSCDRFHVVARDVVNYM